MAAIFPPASQGGVPPGAGVENGYLPAAPVLGEGPLYYSPSCTTLLTAGAVNAGISEVAAAVDRMGFAYNTNIVTNLGDALMAWFANLPPPGGLPGQALVIDANHARTWGAPIDAGTY